MSAEAEAARVRAWLKVKEQALAIASDAHIAAHGDSEEAERAVSRVAGAWRDLQARTFKAVAEGIRGGSNVR